MVLVFNRVSILVVSFFLALKSPRRCIIKLTSKSFEYRLIDVAPHYYDLTNFPQCEAKRVLERLYKKREKDREESKNKK